MPRAPNIAGPEDLKSEVAQECFKIILTAAHAGRLQEQHAKFLLSAIRTHDARVTKEIGRGERVTVRFPLARFER